MKPHFKLIFLVQKALLMKKSISLIKSHIHKITESKNVSGWKGTLWDCGSSRPNSLLMQGYPRAHSIGLCPDGCGIPPVKEIPQPLWQSVPVQSLTK